MSESILKDLALVLGVAAITSTIFYKLRLPTILGYLLAGLIIGPYIPIPIFADPLRVEVLSELGVILVMFSIGLEFNLKRFFQILPSSGITAALEISFMFIAGFCLGYLFDWNTSQSIFLGGALSISSSTMIVSKIFEDKPPSHSIKEHVLGILIIQDLIAVLILTILGTYSISKNLSFESINVTISKLFFTLLFIIAIGLFIVPRYIRYIEKINNTEVLIISSTGICFVLALFVQNLGFSVALGAFLAGLLISESGVSSQVTKVSKPLKDVFVAIFFVSIGMSVDPFNAIKSLPIALIVATLVITLQFFIVFLGSALSGSGLSRSIISALSLGQIGEFSFIIAAIGLSTQMVNHEFQAIIVTAGCFTTLASPILWKNSEIITTNFSKIFPSSLRVSFGLYEAWFQKMKENPTSLGLLFGIPKKSILILILDSILLISIPPFLLKFFPDFIENIGISKDTYLSYIVTFIFIAVILLPVIYGFSKLSSSIILKLSEVIFPISISKSESSHTGEILFKKSVWTILCLTVSFPMLALLSPFLNIYLFAIIIIGTFFALIFRLWTTAGKVYFDSEGGSGRLVSALKKQTYNPSIKELKSPNIPGLDNLELLEVSNENVLGKSLLELNIRNLTGATVVSISRGDKIIMFPNHSEILVKGDVLQIWGSLDAKNRCRELLKQF